MGVGVGVGVLVGVLVAVGVKVGVAVSVGVLVGVAVGPGGVLVAKETVGGAGVLVAKPCPLITPGARPTSSKISSSKDVELAARRIGTSGL